MDDPCDRLQQARARLRRIEARWQRYPHDDRLRRLRIEATFRVTELHAYVEAWQENARKERRVAPRSAPTEPLEPISPDELREEESPSLVMAGPAEVG
jgi:hypothetical protein